MRGPENALGNAGEIRAPAAWRTRIPEELTHNVVTELCIDALERFAQDPERPFFLQCGYTDPHHPFTPPGKYWDMYDPAEIPIPGSLGAKHTDPPPFIGRLKDASREEPLTELMCTLMLLMNERLASQLRSHTG